jgi:hypothetical protein
MLRAFGSEQLNSFAKEAWQRLQRALPHLLLSYKAYAYI